MRWLLFLSRLALICCIAFLVTAGIQYFQMQTNKELEVTFVFIWYFMSMLLNPAANFCYLLLFFTNKEKLAVVPKWLRIANGIFLIILLFYVYRLNAQ